MDRRTFIGALGGALTVTVRTTSAQSQATKAHRIGFLGTTTASEFASRTDALRVGLRDLGYVEGQNTVIEYRWANGDVDRLPALAAELVALKVDVLVTHAEGALAAKRATTSIPIVMAFSADAVATGLAASLARPGGNVTGSTVLIPEISAKRLELLKAAAPRINRVAVLVRKGGTWKTVLQMLQSKGNAMNLAVQFFEVRDRTEFESAFSEMAKARVDGLEVSEDPTLDGDSKVIVELAAKYRWPSIGYRGLAEAGGLVGYGVDVLKIYRHAAVFVDKILKGAKPADLPIEQPTQFDLVVNLKTAKALGLTIPQTLLLRADEVIQ
jgi:putative tryptophan/tyrosine transport system substrate-binding protein